jgi:mannose-6-phosphate isomerase-like protein (cupin superfamily)
MAKTKYDKFFYSDFKEPSNISVVAGPQAYFRGDWQIPGAKMNMGWQLFVKPIQLEKEPHTHECDEYLMFLGGELPDLFSSFQAEIDLCMGEEEEKHLITKPTIIFIPKGMVHCPLNFRKIDKPVLFHALLLSPVFTKTMNGKEFTYKGPTAPGAKGPIKVA